MKFEKFLVEKITESIEPEIPENFKEHFEELINTEIKEVLGTIDNETLWALGCEDYEEELMHRENIHELFDYMTVLFKIRKEYIGF